MVKSVVAAMNGVQEFARRHWSVEIEHFTLTGASKRGWTTWLTAAVDSRVQGIAPMVIDVLNMAPQMKHQLKTWGKYSEQIEDYTRRGLQQHLETKPGQALLAIIDPYSYRQVLTQPKLILLGTNDRYWPLDALNLYWHDLPGRKHVLYVPNNGHGLHDLARVVGSVSALHLEASGKRKLPQLSWQLSDGPGHLTLQVTSDVEPSKVSAWVAHSPSRDFREAKWLSYPTQRRGEVYHYRLSSPPEGYAAIFGEAVYQGDALPYYLSTTVKIIAAPAAE
jgi:PhoPQ-activated pathogenicity-related protein